MGGVIKICSVSSLDKYSFSYYRVNPETMDSHIFLAGSYSTLVQDDAGDLYYVKDGSLMKYLMHMEDVYAPYITAMNPEVNQVVKKLD